MKRSKNGTIKILQVVWMGIILFAVCLIIKSVSLFCAETEKENKTDWRENCLLNIGETILRSELPVYRTYLSQREPQKGFVETCMQTWFPVISSLSGNMAKAEDIANSGKYETKGNVHVIEGAQIENMDQEEIASAAAEENRQFLEDDENDDLETEDKKEDTTTQKQNKSRLAAINKEKISKLKDKKEYDYLLKNFYILDSTTTVNNKILKPSELLSKNFKIKKSSGKPQILIYHTHSQEAFSDSRRGRESDTIVGVGTVLANLLSKKYGYNVIHDTSHYDMANGSLDRSKAYNFALKSVKKTLKNNPSTQVVIDLHRDGVSGNKRSVTEINGKKTAQLMFFNGLSRNKKGPIPYLKNPNIKNNLAFSLQLNLAAMSKYPDFTKKIYLKGYRYNLHLMPRCLLIELGNQNNTVQEAKNAMEPLADILNQVLTGK